MINNLVGVGDIRCQLIKSFNPTSHILCEPHIKGYIYLYIVYPRVHFKLVNEGQIQLLKKLYN